MPAAPSPWSTKTLSVLKVSKFWLPVVCLIWIASVPPLRRDFHIIEMLEVRRVLQLAETGKTMRFRLAFLRQTDARQNGKSGTRRSCLENAAAADASHRGAPVLAALAFIIPPDGGKAGSAVTRHRLGDGCAVPARGALLQRGPLRNDIIVGEQNAIERFRRGHQLVAILGIDDFIDERIDAGSAMPVRLREPSRAAACEPQNSRCSLPGDCD